VTPTVVALRSMATSVVDAELTRPESRLPGLGGVEVDEIRHALRRVADKLLHEPTVRVKELANEQGAVSYAAALAELFALDCDILIPAGLQGEITAENAGSIRAGLVVEAANGLHLSKLRAPLTFLRYWNPSLSLIEWLLYIAAHERRHLWQIENILSHPDFPR
jgi:hypothetical protein